MEKQSREGEDGQDQADVSMQKLWVRKGAQHIGLDLATKQDSSIVMIGILFEVPGTCRDSEMSSKHAVIGPPLLRKALAAIGFAKAD